MSNFSSSLRRFYKKNARSKVSLVLKQRFCHTIARVSAVKIAGCVVMMVMMFIGPERTSLAARSAIRAWGLDVAPSLFPYMVFCRLLASQLQGTRLPAMAAACLLGLSGGSPSGASVLCAYAEQDEKTRRNLSALCALTGTISPMFLCGTVGCWLGSPKQGYMLLAAHLFGALTAFSLVHRLTRQRKRTLRVPSVQPPQASDPITQSVSAILGVGGCIVFFSVLAEGIACLFPQMPDILQAVLHAILEIAGGMKSITGLQLSETAKLILSSSLCGFTGLSILSQNLLILRPFGVSFGQLVRFGLLRAVFSAGAMAILTLLC